MLDCSCFLDGYSDYRDGLLNSEGSASFRSHMERCPACARYDRVVSRGVEILLRQGEIEPSAEFGPRLNARLQALAVGSPPLYPFVHSRPSSPSPPPSCPG
jgi:hypothetical protein